MVHRVKECKLFFDSRLILTGISSLFLFFLTFITNRTVFPNVLSSRLISEILIAERMKPAVSYQCGSWSLSLSEDTD
jgi:hypothetical protein